MTPRCFFQVVCRFSSDPCARAELKLTKVKEVCEVWRQRDEVVDLVVRSRRTESRFVEPAEVGGVGDEADVTVARRFGCRLGLPCTKPRVPKSSLKFGGRL